MAGGWAIRVPASSANLGAGFDVLGLAVSLHVHVGVGEPPIEVPPADEHHPATVAFRAAGGTGSLWIRSPIPSGRGLGFSGAVRVAGAAAAIVERHGPEALDRDAHRRTVFDVAAELEQHGDNAAASLAGGLVVVADRTITPVPLGFDPAIVAWVPSDSSTSTNRSRATLGDTVGRSEAVFNLGRVAMFVAACVSGDSSRLRMATEDRLHQPARLAAQPHADAAIAAALDAGAWAAWLSGSGPSVVAVCDPARAESIAARLPGSGHVKHLRIDTAGARVVGHGEVPRT